MVSFCNKYQAKHYNMYMAKSRGSKNSKDKTWAKPVNPELTIHKALKNLLNLSWAMGRVSLEMISKWEIHKIMGNGTDN